MIIPNQAMLISETVYVDGVPAAPTSITAVLYRIVNGVRSPSGVTVTATATANTGEYTFAWTNGAWNPTDEIELRVIPVIDSVSYPATIWRSHGGGGLTATETAAAVWNPLAATYNTADTMGAALGNVPTAAEISFSIASDVINDDNEWDNAKESLVDQIWGTTNRTLTSIADSTGMTTLLTRITGLLQTKVQADTDQTAVISAVDNVPTAAEISSGIASDVVNDDNDWDIAKQSLVGQIWGTTNRTLTSIADSAGMTTLLTRITGLLQTKVQADTDQTAVISAVDNVPTAAEIVSGIRDDSAPYSPSNINLTRKIGSIQPIYIAWATTGATITGTKSINGGPVSSIVGSSVEMSPQPDWDIPPGKFWYELEYDPSDRILSPAIIEYELTDGTESQTIAVAIVR